MALAAPVIAQTYRDMGFPCTITSGNERASGRLEHSKHYKGLALDFRVRDIDTTERRKHLAALCAERLGDEYDVVLKNSHLHVEYDPD